VYKNDKVFVSDPESMLAHMDELGIEKAVLMSMGESPAELGSNGTNYAISTRYPERFAWMCNVDICDPEQVYEKLARCKERGAVGIGELTQNLPLTHPFLQAVFAAAEKLSMPVTFHMSPEVGYNYGVVDEPGLPLLEETLQAFPKVKFLGHSQPFWIEISGDAPTDPKGRNAWGKGEVTAGGTLTRLFETHPNLYGDLSANSGTRAIMRDESFGLCFLEKYADRLLFGTDMLNAEQTMLLAAWMEEKLSEGKLTFSTCEKIFYRNAQNLFGL
jgi:predicted TIM-barrel fold metal-dependent hydrolase